MVWVVVIIIHICLISWQRFIFTGWITPEADHEKKIWVQVVHLGDDSGKHH